MNETEIVLNTIHPRYENSIYYEEMFVGSEEDNRAWFRDYCQDALIKLHTNPKYFDVPAEASPLTSSVLENQARW